MMLKIKLFVIFLVVALACNKPTTRKNDKLYILTTTGIVADGIKNIVKDAAHVEALMGAGVDPHLYKATQADIDKLTKADIIIYNGLHLEGKMTNVFEKLKRHKVIFALADGLNKQDLIQLDKNVYDPHIWFDVKLWQKALTYATNQLKNKDSLNAKQYQANATAYFQKLDSLDAWIKILANTIPPHKRMLITAHDAFGYFGRAYNFKVYALQGISTLAEFGLADINNLVKLIIDYKVPAIFLESSVSDKAIRAVIEGAKSKNYNLTIGGTLYSDAMGDANTPQGNYIGMIQYNVTTILEPLKPLKNH